MTRKAFNFYKSYWDIGKEIEDLNQRLEYYEAIFLKQFEGKDSELNGIAKFAYISQKHSIDKQVEGFNHGNKGGRPLAPPPKGSNNPPPKGRANQVQEEGKGEEKEEVKIDFSVFWKHYPRKEGKPKSKEKWDKLPIDTQQKILNTLPTFLKGKELKFVPMPETYFNKQRWEDELGHIPTLTDEQINKQREADFLSRL